LNHAATDCLVGAEERTGQAAGEDDAVGGRLARQPFCRRTAFSGCQAKRLEVALVEAKEGEVRRASAGGVGLGGHGSVRPAAIPVADDILRETDRLHLGQTGYFVAEGEEGGEHVSLTSPTPGPSRGGEGSG